MLLQLTILFLSIVALYWGAEFSLEAAEKVGRFFGLSPLVIGLLLVGFGTSLPEFFVSQMASYKGEVDIAMGNIIGSNIANLFLVLGISGVIGTLSLQTNDIKRQVVIHLFITTTLAFIIYFVGINLISTTIFSCFFIFYLFDTFKSMKNEAFEEEGVVEKLGFGTVTRLLSGFALLYAGGDFLVSSGTALGNILGVSSYVISAILVAFGTSFPELVTAILACIKKKDSQLIVGNIIGSNIFNIAFVLGSVGFYDIKLVNQFTTELVGLFVASFILIGLVVLKKNFGRLSGLIYLCCYGAMISFWITS